MRHRKGEVGEPRAQVSTGARTSALQTGRVEREVVEDLPRHRRFGDEGDEA